MAKMRYISIKMDSKIGKCKMKCKKTNKIWCKMTDKHLTCFIYSNQTKEIILFAAINRYKKRKKGFNLIQLAVEYTT